MTGSAPESTPTPTSPEREPGRAIQAVPVRHPGRWVTAVVILVLVAMFVHMLVTNSAFHWRFMAHNALSGPVLQGALTTVALTLISMAMGITFGVVLAVMLLSENPILRWISWLYVWFFRAVPRVVLLVLFGNLGILYRHYDLGFPFDWKIAEWLHLDLHLRFLTLDARAIVSGFVAAVLGLGLSEAAYMAEIVRAGVQSIPAGQLDACRSLGMGRLLSLRRVILPQAMRVIIPPTGNETIAMIKDTALVAYVPAYELWFQLQAVGTRAFLPFPMFVAACLWYLFMTSILMILQFFLERRFANTARRRAQLKLERAGVGGA